MYVIMRKKKQQLGERGVKSQTILSTPNAELTNLERRQKNFVLLWGWFPRFQGPTSRLVRVIAQ